MGGTELILLAGRLNLGGTAGPYVSCFINPNAENVELVPGWAERKPYVDFIVGGVGGQIAVDKMLGKVTVESPESIVFSDSPDFLYLVMNQHIQNKHFGG